MAEKFLLICMCVFFSLILLAVTTIKLTELFKAVHMIRMEMDRADDLYEYYYWRRELSVVYLMMVPGMPEALARKWMRRRYRRKQNR